MPNKLSQFWQELKRRNVVRVVTVYAGAAFVIIELINNVTEPLRLPEWTPTLVIILLLIGFPIVVIFSWIYDVHPEGGLVKTEPAHKVKPDDIPKSSNSWKIASYISFVVIVGLILLNVIPRTYQKKVPEILNKSIAVLPFISLSDDPEKQYQADGVMDAILLHLSKIEDLRVIARTSVEQYRGTSKTAADICEELNVAYVLEGSFQKYGDQARLIVQLIRSGTEEHVWANNYDRQWKDIFAVQSEVAQSVAGELQAVITPEVKQRIEKILTSDLTAYDYYLKGQEEYQKYWTNRGLFNFGVAEDVSNLDNAEEFFKKALEYDSAFARAYIGLARVYWHKYPQSDSSTGEILDTVFNLADMALSFDDELADAYTIKGDCYSEIGNREQADREYDRAIDLNPNDWLAYRGKGYMYAGFDYVLWIDNLEKAAFLNQGPELPSLLRELWKAYIWIGFVEKAMSYEMEAQKLDRDSIQLYFTLQIEPFFRGDFEKLGEFARRAYEIDSTNLISLVQMGYYHMFLGQNIEALKYMQSWIEISQGNIGISYLHRIGYVYWENGMEEEADYYFDKMIEDGTKEVELGRTYDVCYDLAGVYAFRGETEKAYENLRLYNQKRVMNKMMVSYFHFDPLFNGIRDEPEFQQIVRDVEAKYQAEHERVRQWLEEKNMY